MSNQPDVPVFERHGYRIRFDAMTFMRANIQGRTVRGPAIVTSPDGRSVHLEYLDADFLDGVDERVLPDWLASLFNRDDLHITVGGADE